jgi:SNF2-related domain/Helicase conserved C-terminal domain
MPAIQATQRRNMRGERCSVCDTVVEATKGYLYGPPWTVKCEPCSGVFARSLVVVVSLDGAGVILKPTSRLGDRFDAYRAAIEGARYIGDDTNKLSLNKTAAAIAKLGAAGFVLDIQPGVVEAATAASTASRKATVAALVSTRANVDAIDEKIRARGTGQSLYPFQRAGAEWLAYRYGALLADQMGLGKTLQTLAALPPDAQAVVVGPAVAKGVWVRETNEWRPDLTPTMLSGFGSFRWPKPGEIVVTNYDILRSDVEDVLPEKLREPTVGEHVSAPIAVCAGDDVSLLQTVPAGLYQLRRADKKGAWKTLSVVRSFSRALRSFQTAVFEDSRPIQLGLTGSTRVLLHSEPAKAELSFDHAAALLAGVVAIGRWAAQKAAFAVPTPSFRLTIMGAAADSETWSTLATWDENSRLGELESRRLTVPAKVDRIRAHWQVTGSAQSFGVGYRSKSLTEQPPEGTVLIVDEAHICKNSKAERTRNVRALSEAVRARKGRAWCLTATPMLKRPPELWSVLMLAGIAHEAFGSWNNFARLMGGGKDSWGAMIWDGAVDPSVPELLRKVMLRRERNQVLPELPEKTWQRIPVNIEASVRKLCDEAEAVLRAEGIDLRSATAASQLSRMDALVFQKISAARAALATAKIPAMLEIIESYEEQEEPLVVFSAHRAPIDILANRPGWTIITGDENADERTAIADRFQRGELKGLGLTIKAGGVAITLTRSAHALFVDRDWNPGINDQAEDRICRIGQNRGCLIRILEAAHPLDGRVAELLAQKRHLIDASVGASATVDVAAPEIAPEVDLESLAAASRQQLDVEAKAAADAARIAAVRAADGEKNRALRMKEEAEKKAREDAEKKDRKARARAKARGWVEDDDHPERHAPQTPAEHWAASALLMLSANDPDHAREENGVGFNKTDSLLGHWLGLELPKGLTHGQWKLAINACRKYHRQVGPCPRVAEAQSAEGPPS